MSKPSADDLEFPSFFELPPDRSMAFGYEEYDDSEPAHIFLGEIEQDETMRLGLTGGRRLGIERPRYLVRDRAGQSIRVAFHIGDYAISMFDEKKYRIGDTLAVWDARSHGFVDGSIGLRLEEMADVKVIPVPLKALLDATMPSVANTSCLACRTPNATKACSKCGASYCSKECQVGNWLEHKETCIAVRTVQKWKTKGWN